MAGGQRPSRRKALLGVCLFTLAVSALAAAPAAFITVSFLPGAWWTIPAIFIVFSAAAWWVWRDKCAAGEAEAAENEVLRLDEIAGHQSPPPRRRRVVPVWLRTQCTRVGRRIKEGVS